MRLHATTVRGLSVLAILVLAGCSHGSAASSRTMSSPTVPVHPDGESVAPAPLSSTALAKLLLDESDLGGDYTRMPQRAAAHDDVTVNCPALEKLGGDASTSTSLAFPRKAKASFTYAGGGNSELAEELYSATAAKLSKGIGEIFDAMVSCPTYQVMSGHTVVTVGTQVTPAPDLGDEQWSQLLTYSIGGQRSVVKQTAIRIGNVLVLVSGAPGLVDANLEKALDKAEAAL
ncbi:hypothetical protein AQI94_21065 [Streptomyces pseudovenezuelae]|uniref:PknH-like extracellular domain-containing protein n=1 Tax=Streptomyces pseudovenezuelae TaxID=67350 RepID=A0A117PQR8_9ACTN|nr:hypothetical protein AQI94_21065 [Streptomyces pseudovenezuelae]